MINAMPVLVLSMHMTGVCVVVIVAVRVCRVVRDDSGGTRGMINAMPVLVLLMHMTGVCAWS